MLEKGIPDVLWPGPWFNIKMSSYQYRKSHCGDKTVVRSSYLHNGISYTGKMSSLYWIGALDTYSQIAAVNVYQAINDAMIRLPKLKIKGNMTLFYHSIKIYGDSSDICDLSVPEVDDKFVSYFKCSIIKKILHKTIYIHMYVLITFAFNPLLMYCF